MTSPRPPDPDSLALLAHELRTPLVALSGYAEAMRLGVFGPVNPPYDEYAAAICAAAGQLLSLIDDMTEVAEAEAGIWRADRQRFDAGQLGREVVAMFRPRAQKSGVVLGASIRDGAGQVIADRRAVAQILTNLLDNALKFTPRGGVIELTMERDGQDLRMTVADSGPGSGPAIEHRGGQGLGLRLSRALVEAHDGHLNVGRLDNGGWVAVARLAVFEAA